MTIGIIGIIIYILIGLIVFSFAIYFVFFEKTYYYFIKDYLKKSGLSFNHIEKIYNIIDANKKDFELDDLRKNIPLNYQYRKGFIKFINKISIDYFNKNCPKSHYKYYFTINN